jgi:hypothetical protein
VPRWLSLADLKIDYYTQFIKAWIPFNAWYMVSFYDDTVLKNDRKILEHIKNNTNPFRDRIINLLRVMTNISKEFRYHVSQLPFATRGPFSPKS